MEFFNSLNLTQIKGGTKLKQGDLGSVLSYSLTDENGQEITSFDNKTAYINLVLDDKIWFTTTTLVDLSRVTFRIDKAIPIGLYYLEIKIDDYIFPSDRDSIILIEEGSTPYDLKELVPNYDVNMTLKGILSDLSQKGIDITNLKSKIDKIQRETTAQLAQKANKDEVTNVMTPKGNIAYASLPMTGNSVGWYYYCPDGDGTHGAGNYVWNGTSWFFGGTGDEGYNLLKKDLTHKINNPTMSDNDKIPRAKDGSVEWVKIGLPTDEQTNSAVTSWLNQHPEATTTVQDGSIEEIKINKNFLPWIKKDYVTPEMFGAQGDGIKDDSDAFQKCINSGKPINLLPNKEYLIEKTIKIIDRVNFVFEGNYSKINFSCDYLFEICNSNNFSINNVLLFCNGNNGFKFTTRTGTDRCGKTLFKNVSLWGCLIGFEINTPCGYNYFENIHFHKTLDNSVGFVIGEKIDESFTVYPNYIYIDNVTFDGESAGSNKTGIKLFYGTFVYISECDFCNIVNGCAIEICNDKYMHTISIQKNSFFNNSCSLLLKNRHSLDGVLINNNNFYLRNSDVILNRGSEDCYIIGSLSFSENTITGASDAAVWFEMKKIAHFVCLGNNFGRDLTPVYRHCDIVCSRENMILDNPVHRFLDFTDNEPKTINCGGKYYMTEFRWGVFSDKEFSLSTTYDDDGDVIATITPINNSGFMRCFLVPTMN